MNKFSYDEYLDPLVEILGAKRVEEIRKEIRKKIPPDDKLKQFRENWLRTSLMKRLPPVTLSDFVNLPIPRYWARWSIERRQRWWKGIEVPQNLIETLTRRDRVCAVEIWCELYNKPRASFRQTHARDINKELARIPGLVRMPCNATFGPYGAQRGFYIMQTDNENGNA